MHKRSIPRLTLPARYAFCDNFHALNLRPIIRASRARCLSLIGDVMDQFHASRGFVLELIVVVILVIELAYLFPAARYELVGCPRRIFTMAGCGDGHWSISSGTA
jgi:hypothetical protein